MSTEAVQAHDKSNYRPGFWAFMITQFQGAFSDNVFKWMIVYLLLYSIAETGDVETSSKIAAIAGMVFAVPYILFPGIFGPAFLMRIGNLHREVGPIFPGQEVTPQNMTKGVLRNRRIVHAVCEGSTPCQASAAPRAGRSCETAASRADRRAPNPRPPA